MKKQKKVSNNLETPSSGKIILAYLLDILLIFTIIGGPFNAGNALRKGGYTFGGMVMGIKYLSNNGSELTNKQAWIRYLLLFPVSVGFSLFAFVLILILFFGIVLITGALGSLIDIGLLKLLQLLLVLYNVGVLILNIYEITESEQNSPTFIDNKLGIRMVYKPNKELFKNI